MSEVVKKFPAGSRAKYEWSKWTDGQIHECHKGTDFLTGAKSFSMAARKYAERNSLKFSGRVEGDTVFIQFTKTKKILVKK